MIIYNIPDKSTNNQNSCSLRHYNRLEIVNFLKISKLRERVILTRKTGKKVALIFQDSDNKLFRLIASQLLANFKRTVLMLFIVSSGN